MCRGNDHGGRRCPASTNKELRREQNRAYYLKRKAAGTVGATLNKHTPVLDLLAYQNLPNAKEVALFNTTKVNKDFGISMENIWKHDAFEGSDEEWELAKDYAIRLAEGFNTKLTTPDFMNVECVTEAVFFGKNREDVDAVRIRGTLTVFGHYAGIWERQIICSPEPYMEYNKLTLNKNYRGKKIGTQLIKHFDAATKATGITTVKTFANSDIGGYAWAKAGYDWDKDSVNSEGRLVPYQVLKTRFTDWKNKTDNPVEKQELEIMLTRLEADAHNPDYPTPYEVAMCGKEYAKDGLWAGKSTLLGIGWDGVRKI